MRWKGYGSPFISFRKHCLEIDPWTFLCGWSIREDLFPFTCKGKELGKVFVCLFCFWDANPWESPQSSNHVSKGPWKLSSPSTPQKIVFRVALQRTTWYDLTDLSKSRDHNLLCATTIHHFSRGSTLSNTLGFFPSQDGDMGKMRRCLTLWRITTSAHGHVLIWH